MLTGDIPPSAGTAMINGRSIIDKPRAAQRQIGVCPQFDALVDKLTGREHLHLYCRLKGVPSKLVAPVSGFLVILCVDPTHFHPKDALGRLLCQK